MRNQNVAQFLIQSPQRLEVYGLMLTPRMQDWIVKREKRWNILLALRDGQISLIEAEKRLRDLDGKDGR